MFAEALYPQHNAYNAKNKLLCTVLIVELKTMTYIFAALCLVAELF